jgi:photosystem II stability/assembly factor-like uncharacterized protein
MAAFISERRRLLVAAALVLTAALVVSCGGSSKGKPTPTETRLPTRTQIPTQTAQPTPSPPGVSALTFIDAQHGWAIDQCPHSNIFDVCHILSTDDGGRTWKVRVPSDALLDTIVFLDVQDGFVAGKVPDGSDFLFEATTDGGSTWTSFMSNRLKLDSVQLVAPQHGFALARGSGVIVETRDGGKTWPFNYGNAACTFTSLSFPTSSEGWAAGSGQQGPCLFYSADGGQTWNASFEGAESPSVKSALSQVDLHMSPESNLSQIDHSCDSASLEFYNASEARLSLACQGGDSITLATSNGGGTWQLESHETACLNSCQARIYESGLVQHVYYLDLEHAWQRTAHQEISWSSDGGKTWNKVSGPELCCDAKQIFFVDANHGWITLGDSIAVTTDGGRTWTRQPVTIVP